MTATLTAPIIPEALEHDLNPSQFSAAVSYAKSLRAANRVPKAISYLQQRKLFAPGATSEMLDRFLVAAEAERVARLQATVARFEQARIDDEKAILAEAQEDFENTEVSIAARADQWPAEAQAEVVRFVKNPRLVVVRLEDGREASMWRTGHWPIGAKTRVKIETRLPEPIYEAVRD